MLASTTYVGPQALTLAIPLGTFLVVLFIAFFQRRHNV
jgi:hypothetical protein